MFKKSYELWEKGEYTYPMSFGFQPNLVGYLHEDSEKSRLEKQVTENTPPCFIWQTATDGLVPVENSYLMAQALKEKSVPYAHHIFSQWRHGLSLANQDWAEENCGEPYTMEQVFKLVEQVKSGAIPCADEEKEMLLATFDYSDKGREIPRPKCEPNREVQIWPGLNPLCFAAFMSPL